MFGCAGGDGTPAETPGAATAQEAEPAASADGDTSAEPAASAAAGDTSSEGSATFRPDKAPRDFITAGDTTFSFNFDTSDIGKKALEKCEAQAGGDPETRIKCLRKARNRVPIEIQHFFKDAEGFMWVTYRRTGNKLSTRRGIPFEFGETTANTVTVISTGKPLGIGPNGIPRKQVVITIPDNFSIELTDPQRGRLVYDAKLGLLPK